MASAPIEKSSFPKIHSSPPIASIPSEILAMVFVSSLPASGISLIGGSNRFEDTLHDYDCPPWTFLQICKHWHAVALSTPELWATILIHANNWFKSRFIIRLPKRIQLLLRYSMQEKLHIAITATRDQVDTMLFRPSETWSQVFDLIVKESHRWRKLEWRARSILLDKFGAIKGNLPCLQELYLWPMGHTRAPTLPSLFQDCPTLCQVTFGPEHEMAIPALPWLQIKQFTNRFLFRCDFLPIGKMLNLTHLHLNTPMNTQAFSKPHSNTVAPIYLEGVHTLQLEGTGSHILSTFTLPALRHLFVSLASEIQCFLQFLERSGCDLEQLEIDATHGLSDKKLMEALVAVPTVTSLTLRERTKCEATTPELFEWLSFPQASIHQNPVLPLLSDLHIRLNSRFHLEDLLEKLLLMIKSRCMDRVTSISEQTLSRLETIRIGIKWQNRSKESLPPDFYQLPKQGLVVSLYNYL
jgi:hypothetical protein